MVCPMGSQVSMPEEAWERWAGPASHVKELNLLSTMDMVGGHSAET